MRFHLFVVDKILLLVALLLVLGVASSRFAARLGVPMLVLFVTVGMLAGSDGLGGIAFEDYSLAHALGTVALAFILFDGGLNTSLRSVRTAWKPALSLATVGVAITATLTGLAAAVVLGLDWSVGLLFGALVASTDAAAVFSVLKTHNLALPDRLGATLEVESGSNDPMAIFLTLGALRWIMEPATSLSSLIGLFLAQFGLGLAVGLAGGGLALLLARRLRLAVAGLYPVLVGACGLLSFGLAANLGGSGFLAIYITGLVLGNSGFIGKRGSLFFFDGIAWLAQIAMFVLLGLLSFPHRLWEVAPQALAIAAILTFVARPIAVLGSLWPFGYARKELAFISWGGLRGAVPIILATFPLLAGLEHGALLFDVVFFVVLFSAITQGWSLPLLAERMDLLEERPPPASVRLELASLRDVDADIVEYVINDCSQLPGRTVAELALPDEVVLAMIVRGKRVVPPRGSSRIYAGDHLFAVVKPESRAALDAVLLC